MIAVAIDQRADDVRPFTEGITMPVLYDRHHLLTELYAISNVPTVVWIDESDRIVRPNAEAFGTDTFAEFTGAESAPHLEMVRQWVRNGEVPLDEDQARGAVDDLSHDEVLARLHFGWPPKLIAGVMPPPPVCTWTGRQTSHLTT